MRRRFHPALYVILPLAVIGFVYQFEAMLYSIAIPVLVIILLFAIYMLFRNKRLRPRASFQPPRKDRQRLDKLKTRRKNTAGAPFRVIEGRKSRSDDEPPRYH